MIMKFTKLFKSFACVLFLALTATAPLSATTLANGTDPFSYFNVYSLGNIGCLADDPNCSSDSAYKSDFQGVTGAAGYVNFNNFTLTNNGGSEYVLHVGGDAKVGAGNYLGSVEAGGDIQASNKEIDGDVYSGGNINLQDGHIWGNASANGTITVSNGGIHGTIADSINSTYSYEPIIDHTAISDYFKEFSSNVGSLGDTGPITNSYGKLIISAESGVNVFSIDEETLKNAHTVEITGPSDAIVYINADSEDGTAALNSTTWKYYGGISSSNVLLNYYQANFLTYTSSNIVNLLAPLAFTTYSNGVHTGNLIVGNLTGSGQVNLGHFTPPAPVPEPSTMLLFGAGLIGLGMGLRKRQQNTN